MMKKTSDLLYKSKQRKLAYEDKYTKKASLAPSEQTNEITKPVEVATYEAPPRYSIVNSLSSD